jgi:malonyl-CoA/methylmalonyl-CoA synthetase
MDHLAMTGIRSGDRVAILLPKSLLFIYYHLALLRLGAISVPLNPAATPDELDYIIADAEVAAVISERQDHKEPDSLREQPVAAIRRVSAAHQDRSTAPLELPDLDATAIMIYTSGTTGRPKGAEITYANLFAQLEALHTAWGWSSDDRLLHILPLFHVHGLIVALHAALHSGATTILLPRFDAGLVLRALAEYKATIFMGVPTMYYRLVQLADDDIVPLTSMRLFTCGSDRLPDDLFRAFQAKFGQTILERYGMTETGMLLSNPLDGERRAGSVGRPLPNVEARIVSPADGNTLSNGQIGEIQVRGPNVFKCYWRQPRQTQAAFSPDGWFHTGDLGLREADGYFRLKGRAKELIITGGYNVYPAEVERVLMDHPAVAECAVFGCPSNEWGERVTAVVILDKANDWLDPVADLMAHCRKHLAGYKVPWAIHIAEELPRNSMGKIVRGELKLRFCPADMT